MGQFLGWASYDIKWRCDHCGEECDPEDAHEHEDCEEEEVNNFKNYFSVGGITAPGKQIHDTTATLGGESGSFLQ